MVNIQATSEYVFSVIPMCGMAKFFQSCVLLRVRAQELFQFLAFQPGLCRLASTLTEVTFFTNEFFLPALNCFITLPQRMYLYINFVKKELYSDKY